MRDEQQTRMDFVEFMAAQQRPLLRFAAALTGSGPLADDIVADVFGRAYERWHRISNLDRPDAYVRRMVVNEFISRKRRDRFSVATEQVEALTSPFPDHAQRHAEDEDLRAKVTALPARQRAAIVLRYFEGMSDAEIAELLGCATGTVRSLISRALAALRDGPDEIPAPRHAAAMCALPVREETT